MEGLAGSIYSNIRGDLVPNASSTQPAGATAYVILNYIKGRDNWVVTGEAFGMNSGNYIVAVGTGGICNENGQGDVIAMFTISALGDAFFHTTGVEIDTTNRPLDGDGNPNIDIIRVYPANTACLTDLVANEDLSLDGDLVFRGTQRVK